MMINNIPCLTGGIFFSLLIEARKPRISARKNLDGLTDGLSEPEMMRDLLYVVTGEKIDAEKIGKDTSQYKTCNTNSTTYISFNSPSTIRTFDENIKKINPEFLNRMSEFIQMYIDVQKYEWLAKALIDTIFNDKNIHINQNFNVSKNKYIKKSDLLSVDFIELNYFLLSILHFIITKKIKNKDGRDTYKSWYTQNIGHGPWKFNNENLGKVINHEINVKASNSYNLQVESHSEISEYHSLKYNITKLYSVFSDLRLSKFNKYLNAAKTYYSKIKTILYTESPRNFDELYVCNDLKKHGTPRSTPVTIENINTINLINISQYTIISGNGGIGKSMMMKHLLFDAIDNFYSNNLLPILITLRNIKNSDNDLLSYCTKIINEFDSTIGLADVKAFFESRNCILLMDGYDEINNRVKTHCQELLSKLIKTFPKLNIVISSRPSNTFVQLEHFTVLNILPFNKEKALELIDKLDFHDKDTKAKFRYELEHNFYFSHREFASNPLLLTIMLMTYSTFGEIPAKQHIFFSKAYDVLSRGHDATKGAYVREMHTKLTPEDFALYFSEFCARTYRDSVYEFTKDTFTKYMNCVIKRNKEINHLKPNDFLLDLMENLCLMYQEANQINFIHRSFQEYFCAFFFTKQMDDTLYKVIDLFESKFDSCPERTFVMLYDMIPNRIDRYVFLPFLNKLWKECDVQNGYWSFLEKMYPMIYAVDGYPDCVDYFNMPTSNLYDYFTQLKFKTVNREIRDLDWPHEIDLCDREDWVLVQEPYHENGMTFYNNRTITIDEWYYEFGLSNSMPEISDTIFKINVSEIRTLECFSELQKFIENDEFLLKKEYNNVREITKEMEKKYSDKPESDDWFDDF